MYFQNTMECRLGIPSLKNSLEPNSDDLMHQAHLSCSMVMLCNAACVRRTLSLSLGHGCSASHRVMPCMAHTTGFLQRIQTGSNGEAFRPAMTIQLSKRETYPLRCSARDELDHLICFHDSTQRILIRLSTEQLRVLR